jgi:hypothetical protein
MKKNVLSIGLCALVIALIVPTASRVGNDQTDDEVLVAMVLIPGQDGYSNLGNHIERIIAPYEGFAMVELTREQKENLEALGAFVFIDETSHLIGIDGHFMDTRFPESAVKEELRLKPRAGESGGYLVQFIGPIKNDWQEVILRLGAERVAYYPYNTLLVKATPEVRVALGGLDFVQWVGGYHPAYKIRPVLMDLKDDETRRVKILTYKPEGIGAVLSRIDKTSVMLGYRGDDFGLVKAELTIEEIEKIAILDEVSYVEPIYEMSTGNANMQWIMQTNVFGDRKIWDEGLNGTGQIVTYADTGLDYDHRMFRESSGVIQTGDIYNETDETRRKLIRYQPMAQWFDDNGIDKDGNGIPETLENPNNDGVLEAYSDSPDLPPMSGHGTRVSGTGAGNDDPMGTSPNDGGAKGAKIYFQDIGSVWQDPEAGGAWDDYLTWIPDDYYWLFIDSYTNGSRIHSNSWGARNSDYDLEAMMVDKFMWEHPDFLVLFSNGNGGWFFDPYDVGSPATAKSAVSVGSSGNTPSQNNVATYSSRGPTTDGRRKPTLIAVGVGTSAVSSGNPLDNSPGTYESWSGTSYACPAAASTAAMIREYFEKGYYPNGAALAGNEIDPTAALVKALMMASGQMMKGNNADYKDEKKYPNNSQGWGRILLDDVLYFNGDSKNLLVVDNTEGINTGDVVEYEFNVTNNTEPLKFFIAWSDYPGAVGASPALVNNLDLLVEAPNGTTFKGNRFASSPNSPTMWLTRGFSLPGGAFDSVNTDEGVIITIGNSQVGNWVTTGTWKARIVAQNVPAGPQPFGLVVTGALNLSYGIVTLDKKTYSESDTVHVTVRDSDLAPPNNFTTAVSTTETFPETVWLTETTAGSGIWTGSIDTDFGMPNPDGLLQVKEDDTITVTYNDISPIHTSTATAKVDASGPAISDVRAEDITNAYARILWTTDEPSTSKVYWGKTTNLENTPLEESSLMTAHSIELIGLDTNTMYYYDVESSDWFGHTTRDNNGGIHYKFKTTDKAEILVVFGDDTFDKEERYRSALAASGWSFNEWYADRQGDPPITTLQEYKIVMWQTGYEQYPPLEDSQRTLLTQYLDEGGRLFVTSHDVAWTFGDSARSNFYNTDRDMWLRATLKARYQIDPSYFSCLEGIPGNPISNNYLTGACPASYTPHRSGGAGDEVWLESAGGFTLPVWSATGTIDYGGVTDPDPTDYTAVMWNSTSANGTLGNGIWGGKPSKLVAFFFEFTRLDHTQGVDDSAIRNDILKKVIKWLLDNRDHPDVLITHPDGGEEFAGDEIQVQWSATPFGTQIVNQSIYYSGNRGQSWEYIKDAGATATTYDWNISGLPNGNGYLVKVVARDDGLPPLQGSDTSNGSFSIVRPGGDNEGPITVPGSIQVQPHYVERGTTVWFNATVDDTNKGNSNITQVEYFINCTQPDDADYGLSPNQMNAADGDYDAPIEDVTWSGTLDLPSAWYIIWVHGKDAANNWGPFESRRFLVIDPEGPDIDLTPPSPPLNVRREWEGPGSEHMNISWDASPDDDGTPTNVDYYDVLYSTSFAQNAAGYANLISIKASAAAGYYLIHQWAGNGDPSNHFYMVSARDQSCNVGQNSTQLAKYNRAMTSGKNMVSIPLVLEDDSIDVVLQFSTINAAWWYDPADTADPYKMYNPYKPANDLLNVNRTMALWIVAQSDTNLLVVGKVPTTTTINLLEGWNFVGYPSFISKSVEDALDGVSYDRVEGFDALSIQKRRLYSDSDLMVAGYGYWIKMDAPDVWNISN